MWIRSQNKCHLVDIKGCLIDDDSWNDEYNIVGWMCASSIDDNAWVVGKYETKEKAMKVLDELQCRIARSESGVYQMPEDEE